MTETNASDNFHTVAPSSYGQMLKHFSKECIGGSMGGCAGIIVGHPLDTIRVRLQTSKQSVGAMHMLREAIKKEGTRSLFKGMLSPLIGETINNCILFGVYNGLLPYLFKNVIGTKSDEEHADFRRNSIARQFLSGSLAGACIALVVCPTELIKIRLQTNTDPIHTRSTNGSDGRRGFLDCAKYIWNQEGKIRGIYHGFSATMMRELSFNGVYFAVYEQCKTLFSHFLAERNAIELGQVKKLSEEMRSDWRVVMSSGALSGLSAWAIAYQTDVIKSVVQSRSPVLAAQGVYKVKIADVFKECWQSRSLFKGLGPTLVRAVPANAATFWVYELTSSYLHSL